MVLVYDFSNEYYRDGKDIIEIHEPEFRYEVKDVPCDGLTWEMLYDYYRDFALELAAYKTMLEYSDTCFKCT